MNYYERHLGDYARDAGHLSMMEHGAYTLLLDRYYTTEKPIPADQAHRVCRARTKDEREAVDAVLAEFFTLQDGAWINGRANREVLKMQAKVEAARTNGQRGGRPKKNPAGTEQKPTGFPLGSDLETQPKALQSPDTSNTPLAPKGAESGEDSTPVLPCPYDEIVKAYHEELPTLPAVRLMKSGRQRAIRKVWGWVLSSKKPDGQRRAETPAQALDWFRRYFATAAENDFLMGRTPRSQEHAGWVCDIDFLMTDRGMKQVIEKTRDAA